jgi:hypothetical protein
VRLWARHTWVLATLLAGLLSAGCGGVDTSGDAAKIRQTVTQELGDLARGDGPGACALATPTGQTELASGSPHKTCSEAITLVSQNLAPEVKQGLLSVKVNKVTISGGSATVSNADITSTQGSVSSFLDPASAPTVLVKQPDGSWKIAG